MVERMNESDGYFSQDRVPGRSTGATSEAAQAIARSENETSSAEGEVSDPEMWMMSSHHFSSESEDDDVIIETERPSGSTGH